MDTRVIESRLKEIEELNRMWKMSDNSLSFPEFFEQYLSKVEEHLNDTVPIYAHLLDKDELTAQDEWNLKFLQDSFLKLYGSVSILFASLFTANLEVPKELKERAMNLLIFLGEIMGIIPESDKELEKAIDKGLKDIQEGKVIALEDFLNED